MINNLLNSRSDFMTLLAQSVKDSTHTLTTELQDIAPEVATQFLSQFGEKEVEQLLQQQLVSLITVSSATQLADYPSSDEELALLTVISSQHQGLQNNENSAELMTRMEQSVADIYQAYTNTSDILSSLGQLGHQQKSFLASSEKRVERTLDSYMQRTNLFDNEGDSGYRFEISVTTKEGDTVNITLSSSQGYDQDAGETVAGFNLSYQVQGNLSEAEHKALTEVLAGVGEMADEFFKLGDTPYSRYAPANQTVVSLDFLADFDNQQLSGLDISFATNEAKSPVFSDKTLEMSYQFDQDSQQQALEFEWNEGIKKIDFALDMSIFGGTDVKQMAQYIATLDKNLEDSQHNSKDHTGRSAFGDKDDPNMLQGFALFKGAFAKMSSAAQRYSNIESVAAQQFTNSQALVAGLVDNMIINDPRYLGLGNATSNTLGAGISKLADFNATFSYSLEARDSDRPKTTVELSQITEQDQSGEFIGLTQSKSVTSRFGYQSNRPDYFEQTENYNINAAVKNQQLLGLDQQHEVNIDQKTYRPGVNPYQFDLMMERTEQTVSESSIRLINDIWLEQKEDSKDIEKRERVIEYGKPDYFEQKNHHSYNKLMLLIGDLEKLAQDKKIKQQYLIELANVNRFMDKST
ncbi:MAG: hypothetical protein HRU22_08560 [Gammaproteobacteria bacterium]|nr:hypothetical protein [Gammaproteobacteria bacterium]